MSTNSIAHESSNSLRKLYATLEYILNRVLAITNQAAARRRIIVQILFLFAWFILTILLYPAQTWKEILSDFFQTFLNVKSWTQINSLLLLAQFPFKTFLNPVVLRHLMGFFAAFWLARKAAAIYLADIFEKEIPIAEDFLQQAVFGLRGIVRSHKGSNEKSVKQRIFNQEQNTICIREGKVVEADQDLPVVQIGGPGYIQVEVDSAILIEAPDGTFRVVGPTSDNPGHVAVVEGFERLRQGVDLRDIVDSQVVPSRSRDGIPIRAEDLQYSYSVHRGKLPVRSTHTPYPFDPEAVKRLVYHSTRPVEPGKDPDAEPDWKTSQPGKLTSSISDELGKFISSRGLSEFLTSIGEPETEKDTQSETVNFSPRTLITKLFHEAAGYKKRLLDKGIQLNWIGVGTWRPPTEIISNKNLEAWKISRENFLRNLPEELKKIRDDARLSEYKKLVESIVLNYIFNGKDRSDEEVIDKLIGSFHSILRSARELFKRNNQPVPKELQTAIEKINRLRGPHWVGME